MTAEQLNEALAEVLNRLTVAAELAEAICDAQPPYDVPPEVDPLSVEALAAEIELDLNDPDDYGDLVRAIALLRSLGFAIKKKRPDGTWAMEVVNAPDPDFAALEAELRNGRPFHA